ncbi:MAG: ECF-type sigma factor [Myxococcota bacterium]
MPHPPPNDDLVAALYDELRRRARRLVDHHGGSVAPSSLVHEAMEKLYRADPDRWNDEVHFKATAARAMRQVLLDRVKAKGRAKRWGGLDRVTLDGVGESPAHIDAIDLHNALEALDAARPRTAEVVRLRILGGMEQHEIATMLDVSEATVKREWRAGRAFVLSWMG